jgi:carboxypeptidase Taq
MPETIFTAISDAHVGLRAHSPVATASPPLFDFRLSSGIDRSMASRQKYDAFIAALREQSDLSSALALLYWDQETHLPPGATAGRARQVGVLAGIVHERETDPRFLALVDGLGVMLDELSPLQQVNVREIKWRLDRKRRLDTALVRERAALKSEAHAVWIRARREDDFNQLAPYLTRLVAIEQRVAAAIDSSVPAYDVMLEGYERGATTVMLEQLFAELRGGLVPLIERVRIVRQRRPIDASALRGDFPPETQRRFNHTVAEQLGFNFSVGRLDESVHPFTTEIGDDVRITTRIDPHDLRYALFSTIHETGHALYEQGLQPGRRGTPLGTACSMGVHESQSRLWENLVARSRAFWCWLLPIAGAAFPGLRDRSLVAVLLAANEARPSLIRTEADELTYNLHIMLRFELERALISGDLVVADLKAAWREQMQKYLGIAPDTDRDGVLQDVHWAEGLFGYFPTYCLGNIYAAQLYEAAQRQAGPFDEAFARGNFAPLLGWLRRRVHRHGQTWRASQLIARATGAVPSAQPLLAHLTRKLEWLEAV